ncbi:hypothetical protein BJ138DRAFT_1117742 [Hygrophoropsis aurantiaca]|uniref:Uncharacterized protein n=1 Tax=Hygrophoropsis aurantiaca TaxID=72124 RepID=A0ACB7ZYQ7_9AGAM|nr:hypothetical protein BJ138DRAFT_1117742 [Hygrophoropsis aurantiaca]
MSHYETYLPKQQPLPDDENTRSLRFHVIEGITGRVMEPPGYRGEILALELFRDSDGKRLDSEDVPELEVYDICDVDAPFLVNPYFNHVPEHSMIHLYAIRQDWQYEVYYDGEKAKTIVFPRVLYVS